uniref:Synaptobrevin, longin-like domain protein n=1 Tax=Tanacetum cinerariifolium TaxID=118510 RepID=A0A6L2MWI2_TANCI|nr:synaptobrevin, longin-like domain protein [Tanacetum cinerariifolium]
MNLQDQGVIDNVCSRHMSWNMSYLTDYEEIDGGYVMKKFSLLSISSAASYNKTDELMLLAILNTVRDLQLEDAEGIGCLPNVAIFEQLTLIGSTMASAIICLATNQKFNFSKYIFESMVKNLNNVNKFVMYPRKPRRKVTEVPQPSDPLEHVTDEAVNEEMDNSLVRAANTTSSLEAEQDSGVSTPQSDEDSLKLKELMELYAKMLFDVADDVRGEEVFVSQEVPLKEVSVVNEVNAISTATTTTTTTEEFTLAKALAELKASKPKIDADYLLAQRLQIEEQQELTDAKKATLFMQFLEKRRKFFPAKAAEEKRNKPPTQAQQRKIMCTYLKNIEVKKLKDLKKKSFDSIKKMFDRAFKRVNTFVDYKTELVVESSKEAEAEVTEGSSKRAGEVLEQENAKKQKIEDDKESTELKQCLEIILENRDDVTIDATPLSSKSPTIVDYKIYKEGKKSYFQIFRADGNSHMYLTFSKMLKIFDREDLEVLWRLVKARFKKIKPVDYMDKLLLHNLKTMFKHRITPPFSRQRSGAHIGVNS